MMHYIIAPGGRAAGGARARAALRPRALRDAAAGALRQV